MDPEKNTQIESAEELEAEKKDLAEVKEEEIRESIISEFGFNEEDDKERIDKLVKRETEGRKKLSSAIGQKIKYRDQFTKLKTTPPKTEPSETKVDEAYLDKKVTERLEKRDLEDMEYPDDIKKAISQVAKINEISVKKAVSDPYVAAKIDAWKKTEEAKEAALSRNNKGGGKKSADIDSPPDVDMATPEGRAEYDKWKAQMIKDGH